MIRLFLSFFLTLTCFAEHGGTASWQQKMRELSEQQRSLVQNESLSHRWSLDQSKLFYGLTQDGAQKQFQLDLKTGETTEGPTEKKALKSLSPENFSPSPRRHRGNSGSTSPDKKWKIAFEEHPILINLESGKKKNLGEAPKDTRWETRVRWHSDSSCFALTHCTNHAISQVHLVRSSPKDQVQPAHQLHPYAKPGDKLNIAHPVIFFTDERKPIPASPTLTKDPYAINDLRWHDEKHLLSMAYIERGFGKYRLIEIDADTRFQRIIVEETSDKFVYVFGNCYYRILPDKDEILWLSERTGYNHLYLINRKNGEVIRPLTSGDWIVRKVVSVDEKARTALLEISGYYPKQDPYSLHYALVKLDTGKLTLLTESDGTHELSFSPDKKHYLAKWSRIDHPPVYEIRRTSDQKLISTLNTPDLTPLLATGWNLPERFVTKDRNGKHDIHGVIWRPRNFDKDQKYPIVENIYAGPHGSFVPKKWSSWSGHKSEMVASGFIVVQIDGLGTNFRGRDFHQIAYKNLKDSGFPDRIKWMQEAAAKYPEMDLSRVGIYGGSAGGQSSTAALLHHGDFYKVAVSDCGCHDNRIDKMWWNEQWLDWPLNDSYIENSNRTHVPKLTGQLMLTVGEMDRNVDPSSTYQMVNDLIQADKDFTFFMIPGADHGAGEAPHFRRKRIEFFQTHLQ